MGFLKGFLRSKVNSILVQADKRFADGAYFQSVQELNENDLRQCEAILRCILCDVTLRDLFFSDKHDVCREVVKRLWALDKNSKEMTVFPTVLEWYRPYTSFPFIFLDHKVRRWYKETGEGQLWQLNAIYQVISLKPEAFTGSL